MISSLEALIPWLSSALYLWISPFGNVQSISGNQGKIENNYSELSLKRTLSGSNLLSALDRCPL